MKIDPKHDYKKPLYAIGVATLIGATALFGTACGSNENTGRTKSNRDTKPEGTEVRLAGEETIDPGYVELDGDVAVVETDPTDVELDGVIAVVDTDPTDVELAGGETICETEPSLGGAATVSESKPYKIDH